ncbi:MAG TPA: molybdopterin-binding protein [Xanthomonadaceae bacterium]|nr:molybdopterin-binding protein [Xanthomonadaceae bacterium]
MKPIDRRGIDRRRLLTRGLAGGGALLLAGCDKLANTSWFKSVLGSAGPVTEAAQSAITPANALAREFTEADIAPSFRQNGSIDPQDDDYLDHVDNGFKDWKLEVRGLVSKPLSLSLEDLRAMPSRTQITRHDCVEGWSCIGKWKGVPLRAVLEQAGVKPEARFVVFRCMDTLDNALYYESCRLVDAYHPQTILAYDLNDKPLPVGNGAPLRARLERKLGYKQPKYLSAIELVDSYARIGGGNGGFWEDKGYDWFGGI